MYRSSLSLCLLALLAASSSATAQSTPAQNGTPPATGAESKPQPAIASPAQKATDSQPAGRQPSATLLKVTTRLVLVDAVVTNGSGPILNLKPPDFEILENGKPQTLRFFSLHVPPATSAVASKSPEIPKDVYTNIPQNAPTGDTPTILLLDSLNTPMKDQMYARQQMLKYMKTLNPGRRVAVYLLGSSLRLIQDFTSDPEILKTALQKVFSSPSPLLADPNDTSTIPDLSAPGASAGEIETSIEAFAAEQEAVATDIRVAITMQALREIARNVAGYSGRKNLVWVSAAFPLTIGLDPSASGPQASFRFYAQDIRDTADQLTNAQVAVYPVDAQGLVGSPLADVTFTGRTRSGRLMNGSQMASTLSSRNFAQQNSHDAMNQVADATGGRAFYNRNDIDRAIALSVADGSTYYTLGYYPDDKNWNGRFRKIELKLLNVKGAHLRARHGYYAIDITAQRTEAEQKALRRQFISELDLRAPAATALPFAVRLFPPDRPGAPLRVLFGVDPGALAFQTGTDGLQHGDFKFVVQPFNGKGKPTPGADQTLSTSLKPETYRKVMQQGLHFTQELTLPAGNYALKIGVLDERSGLMGTVTATAAIPGAPEAPK